MNLHKLPLWLIVLDSVGRSRGSWYCCFDFSERNAMEGPGNVTILFVAGFGPIVRDTGESRKLYGEVGISLKEESGSYLHTEALGGAKTLALWPLSQAAQSCFGRSAGDDCLEGSAAA